MVVKFAVTDDVVALNAGLVVVGVKAKGGGVIGAVEVVLLKEVVSVELTTGVVDVEGVVPEVVLEVDEVVVLLSRSHK
jgi:hypothetical protein